MTDEAATAKATIRRQVRERRSLRPPEDVAREGELVADAVLALPQVQRAGRLAAYLALPAEPSTGGLLARCRTLCMPMLLPVVRPDLDLDWALDDGRYRLAGTGRELREPVGPVLGLDAIEAADVVVLPALAVDRWGVRLGQGGGSYDRALARVRPGALLVALLHPGELVEQPLPRQAHDRPVHVVVTAEGVVRLRPGPGSAGR